MLIARLSIVSGRTLKDALAFVAIKLSASGGTRAAKDGKKGCPAGPIGHTCSRVPHEDEAQYISSSICLPFKAQINISVCACLCFEFEGSMRV